jgi:hypothetical protein
VSNTTNHKPDFLACLIPILPFQLSLLPITLKGLLSSDVSYAPSITLPILVDDGLDKKRGFESKNDINFNPVPTILLSYNPISLFGNNCSSKNKDDVKSTGIS